MMKPHTLSASKKVNLSLNAWTPNLCPFNRTVGFVDPELRMDQIMAVTKINLRPRFVRAWILCVPVLPMKMCSTGISR